MRIFFDDFMRKHGTNRDVFKSEVSKFIKSMENECPKFINITDEWIRESTMDEIQIDEPNIKSTYSNCEFLKRNSWIYEDLLEGRLIYKFSAQELSVVSEKHGDITIYDIEEIDKCGFKLRLKSSNSPFDILRPEGDNFNFYINDFDGKEVEALCQIEGTTYKDIKLEVKK